MLDIKGNLSILYNQQWVRIVVEDAEANVRLVEVRMSYEQFALALSIRYLTGLETQFNDGDKPGKIHESKTEFVPINYNRLDDDYDEKVKEALAPFEVDGWKARENDMNNWHNYDAKKKGYRVFFDRWVERSDDSH